MKKAIAKKLRHVAEDQTIGKPKFYTRTIYQQLKRTLKHQKNIEKKNCTYIYTYFICQSEPIG